MVSLPTITHHETEVLIGVALKTVSNYLDHISPAPLDDAFKGESSN
jgi:hypothetical protein